MFKVYITHADGRMESIDRVVSFGYSRSQYMKGKIKLYLSNGSNVSFIIDDIRDIESYKI